VFVKLLGKRRRFLAAGLSTAAIGLTTILVGAEAAVVRAALMGALALFARQVGRQQDGLNSLELVTAWIGWWWLAPPV
jgi:predicted membrane metal-binding protein